MLVVLAVPALVWSGQAVAESRIVCAGQANVPAGWIHTDSAFTPFVCGGGAIPVVPTQWVITRYDNLFRGDRLLVATARRCRAAGPRSSVPSSRTGAAPALAPASRRRHRT